MTQLCYSNWFIVSLITSFNENTAIDRYFNVGLSSKQVTEILGLLGFRVLKVKHKRNLHVSRKPKYIDIQEILPGVSCFYF